MRNVSIFFLFRFLCTMRSFMSELTIIYIFRCVSVTFFGCSSFAKGFAIYIRMCHCVAHIYFVDSQPIDVRDIFVLFLIKST